MPNVKRIMGHIRRKEAFTIGRLTGVNATEAKALSLISKFLNSSPNWVPEQYGLEAVVWRPQHKSVYGNGTPA